MILPFPDIDHSRRGRHLEIKRQLREKLNRELFEVDIQNAEVKGIGRVPEPQRGRLTKLLWGE